MSAFFEGMSKELDEAARIDGASEMQNLWHIVVPLAKPIMTSVMLIVFANTWNEFLFSNTFLQKLFLSRRTACSRIFRRFLLSRAPRRCCPRRRHTARAQIRVRG